MIFPSFSAKNSVNPAGHVADASSHGDHDHDGRERPGLHRGERRRGQDPLGP